MLFYLPASSEEEIVFIHVPNANMEGKSSSKALEVDGKVFLRATKVSPFQRLEYSRDDTKITLRCGYIGCK